MFNVEPCWEFKQRTLEFCPSLLQQKSIIYKTSPGSWILLLFLKLVTNVEGLVIPSLLSTLGTAFFTSGFAVILPI